LTYYHSSPAVPHPTKPDLYLCRIRNRGGWYVEVSGPTAARLRPFDLFIDKAGVVHYKNILGKQLPLSDLGPHTLARFVTELAT
jgi:hypothetical protein